jgi:hypothetical protein
MKMPHAESTAWGKKKAHDNKPIIRAIAFTPETEDHT